MSNTKSNGKVAFITGGNRGLGLETARELGKQGIVVVLGSRDSKKGEAAAAKLRDEGITAESLGFDVNKSQDHQKAYDYFEKKYGRLDILVNNAGVLKEGEISATGSGPNPVTAVSPEMLRETFETNFFASGCADTKTVATHTQIAGRPNCECFQHPGFSHAAFRSELADLPFQDFRLRRVEGCAERLHDPSSLRIARQQNQSELRASRLGED